jgi:hypothetical protein
MLSHDVYNSSYWLLGDDQLQMSSDRTREALFRAHLKHSLLFNPSLLFSDSMVINNRNFRHIVETDKDFRELLAQSNFSIAIRTDDNGRPNDLLELRNTFKKDGKSRVPELDEHSDGLSFLQNHSKFIQYTGSDLAKFYTTNVVDIFQHDAVQERLPNGVWKDVHELAREARRELGPKFGRDFFVYKLRDRLIERRKGTSSAIEAEIDQHMEVIKSVSEYHYITALPSTINYTDPIYASKHADAFKICRGRGVLSSVDGNPDTRPLTLTTDLASYESCIAELTAKDIIDLRGSDEGLAYFKAKFDFDVSKFEESKRNFYVALSGYVSRIDKRIIERFGPHHRANESLSLQFELKSRSKIPNKLIDYSPDILVYISIGALLAHTDVSPFWSLLCILPALNRAKKLVHAAVDNPYADPSTSDELSEQALRELIKDELRTRGGRQISAEINVSKTSEKTIPDETIYTGSITS